MTKTTKLSGDALAKKTDLDISAILKAGLSVIENKNNSEYSKQTNHLSIVGGIRRVEYYPSTGSVLSNPVKNKFKRRRGHGLNDAIRIAKEGK